MCSALAAVSRLQPLQPHPQPGITAIRLFADGLIVRATAPNPLIAGVLAVADDDSMLDFPGVGSSESARPEIRGRGLPNQFCGCGFGWSMVYMGSDVTGTTERETCGIGIGAGGDVRGRAVRERVVASMSAGRF